MAVHTVSQDERILAMVLAPFPATKDALLNAMNAFHTAYGVEPKLMHAPKPMMRAMRVWLAADRGKPGDPPAPPVERLPEKYFGMDVVYSAPFFAMYTPNPNYKPAEEKQRPNARERALARRKG